jgi:hypothetical protein
MPNTAEGGISMSSGPSETGQPGLDALLADISEVDFDALREAEFDQIQGILDLMNGKTIKAATIEEKRIVLETSDGNRYFFYGFMSGVTGN